MTFKLYQLFHLMVNFNAIDHCPQVKSQYTTGAASRSFTSTSYDPVTKNEFEYVKVEKNPKKKGYVQMHTTHGDLNIELHCDIAPRACENFITLCERGYYNGVAFHRSIRYYKTIILIHFNNFNLKKIHFFPE